jgi:medium-chain acyl-[acyl-carrier-protein] hydrolase
MYSRMGLGYLVNLFVQSAMSANASIGFGFDDIRKQNLFWLFSRLTVEIYKPHLWREPGEVHTWLKNQEKFIYLRDFLIYDQDRQVVAKATSNWVPVDLEAKRPKNIDGLDDSWFVKDKEALNYPPEKIFQVKDGETFDLVARYFDMDLNLHVSSYRYTDWIMDTFPMDFHSKNYPKKISINFLSESNAGENIQLIRKAITQTSFAFEAINNTGNKPAFRAIVEF